MEDYLLSGTQAAELVGVSVTTFYKMTKEDPGLEPVPTLSGSIAWSLRRIMVWAEAHDDGEKARRLALIAQWKKQGSDADGVTPK